MFEVEKGWQSFMEVNRVIYDPQLVSIEQLEDWLKESATYRRTLEPEIKE